MWPFAKAGSRIPGQPFSFFFCESSREGTAASRKQWSPVCQLRCATNQGILFLRRWLTSLQLWSKPSCQFQIILKITLASAAQTGHWEHWEDSHWPGMPIGLLCQASIRLAKWNRKNNNNGLSVLPRNCRSSAPCLLQTWRYDLHRYIDMDMDSVMSPIGFWREQCEAHYNGSGRCRRKIKISWFFSRIMERGCSVCPNHWAHKQIIFNLWAPFQWNWLRTQIYFKMDVYMDSCGHHGHAAVLFTLLSGVHSHCKHAQTYSVAFRSIADSKLEVRGCLHRAIAPASRNRFSVRGGCPGHAHTCDRLHARAWPKSRRSEVWVYRKAQWGRNTMTGSV